MPAGTGGEAAVAAFDLVKATDASLHGHICRVRFVWVWFTGRRSPPHAVCVCVWCRQVVAESARSDAERLAKPVLSQADITAALDEVNCWDLIGHHLEAAFTGCVRPDTAMFIWDQVPRLRVTCHLQRVASDDDCARPRLLHTGDAERMGGCRSAGGGRSGAANTHAGGAACV